MSLAMPLSNTLRLPSRTRASRPSGDLAIESGEENGFEAFCMSSAEILKGKKTVAIKHNGLTYRLQATRLGKLILTK